MATVIGVTLPIPVYSCGQTEQTVKVMHLVKGQAAMAGKHGATSSTRVLTFKRQRRKVIVRSRMPAYSRKCNHRHNSLIKYIDRIGKYYLTVSNQCIGEQYAWLFTCHIKSRRQTLFTRVVWIVFFSTVWNSAMFLMWHGPCQRSLPCFPSRAKWMFIDMNFDMSTLKLGLYLITILATTWKNKALWRNNISYSATFGIWTREHLLNGALSSSLI